jgi:hypothetical protein
MASHEMQRLQIRAVNVASPSHDPVKKDFERRWPFVGVLQRLVSAVVRHTAVERVLGLALPSIRCIKSD